MAGETQKSTSLTNRDAGKLRQARLVNGTKRVGLDSHQFAAATELEAADNLIMDLPIPSNAIITSIAHINDDLDTHACTPTLVIDVGLAARDDFTSVTSAAKTKHSKDDILDAALLVDGNTDLRAATTDWTEFTAKDATNLGPEDRLKAVWELLGYDEDPKCSFNIVVQSQAASAGLSAAGDLAVKVEYVVDK